MKRYFPTHVVSLFLTFAFSVSPVIFSAIFSKPVCAQEPIPSATQTEGQQLSKTKSLLAIIRTKNNIQQSLAALNAKSSLSDSDQEKKKELQNRLSDLEWSFKEIASGIDLSLIETNKEIKEFRWSEELQQLLQPLINELKRATSQPREIDRFRTTITEVEQQINLTKTAISNLQKLKDVSRTTTLKEEITQEIKEWDTQLQRLKTQHAITSQKLRQRLGERKSLFETVGSLPDIFFRSRGKNLLFAVLATFFFLLVLNWIKRKLMERAAAINRQRSFQSRLFYVGYLFLSGIGSVVMFLLALFFLGDWVLLIIGVLLLLGIIWTSRQLISHFWTQATILLNMGTVREGERLSYAGIPWKLRSINFYSYLENPLIDGGVMRLPIRDLEQLRSREYRQDEPWFPTRNGDWVILDDDTYGKVVWQGIDEVRISQLGGAVKTYRTTDFLGQNPKNLTLSGFRVSFSFGVDYADQSIATEEMPAKFKAFIEQQLEQQDLLQYCNLKVEFEEAAASSLNIAILADFTGELGDKYQFLGRLLQKLCVDACNKYGWNIPFGQLTVHMAKNDGE